MAPVGREGIVACGEQSLDSVGGVGPSCARPELAFGEGVEVLDCVPQPAGGMRNGDGSVGHCVQLVQPTGLESRGHDDDVCSSDDPVGDGDREPDPSAEVVGELALHLPHAPLEGGHPAPEHHHLHVAVAEAPHGIQEEVGPLLGVQPANEADERDVRVDVEAELPLELLLAGALARHVIDAVVGRDVAVCRRVPLHHVDPIRHAVELVLAGAEEPVQEEAACAGKGGGGRRRQRPRGGEGEDSAGNGRRGNPGGCQKSAAEIQGRGARAEPFRAEKEGKGGGLSRQLCRHLAPQEGRTGRHGNGGNARGGAKREAGRGTRCAAAATDLQAVAVRQRGGRGGLQGGRTLGRGDLPGVALAHGHDAVGGHHGALHDVHGLPLVELVRAHVLGEDPLQRPVPVGRHPELPVGRCWLHPLVHEVVDREDRPRVVVHAVGTVPCGHVAAHHPRVPVVGHKHALVPVREAGRAPVFVSPYVKVERRLAGCEGQEAEAELVVPKGAGLVAVRVARAVEARVVDEDKVDPVGVLVEVPHGLVAAHAEVERHPRARVLRLAVAGVRDAVEVPRGDDHDAVPALGEGHREGASDVGETAGFAPRGDLGGDEDDVHDVLRGLLCGALVALPVELGGPKLLLQRQCCRSSGNPPGDNTRYLFHGNRGLGVHVEPCHVLLAARARATARHGWLDTGYLFTQLGVLSPELLDLLADFFWIVRHQGVVLTKIRAAVKALLTSGQRRRKVRYCIFPAQKQPCHRPALSLRHSGNVTCSAIL
mmetsp:Transcript_26826/g.63635  ORF Transcript_26826/g.63635 Transcript_26826/m.63635 type:complete len:766 (-) Transcript_26826:186-2483(-)